MNYYKRRILDSEISGGNFTATGGDLMFAKSKGLIITGGNFTASGWSKSCGRVRSRAAEAKSPHVARRQKNNLCVGSSTQGCQWVGKQRDRCCCSCSGLKSRSKGGGKPKCERRRWGCALFIYRMCGWQWNNYPQICATRIQGCYKGAERPPRDNTSGERCSKSLNYQFLIGLCICHLISLWE